MTRRNRKKTTRRVAPAGSNVVAAESEKPLKGRYDEARRLAQAGKLEEAVRIYDQLKTVADDPKLRALVENDLGAIAAMQGRAEDALEGWKRALAEDNDCQPARLNREMIEAEFERVRNTAPPRSAPLQIVYAPRVPEPTREPKRGPVRVAILSFLFNWPSTGGGNVHTYELAKFLMRAGYEVRHVYARYPGWGIGRVEGELPYPSEAIELDASNMRLEQIRKRYREAVDAFDPDQVIITDSWNIKPILAQAVRGYPYILRMQAMECLCPLNNLRLLFDERGRFRQCPLHQLANPLECARCLERNGHYAGALHQAERALCGVGSPEYHQTLIQAFAEAEAVLVVNPLAEVMVSPYARSVRVVTAGIDPARFPWPQPTEGRQREPWTEGRTILCFAGLIHEPMKGFAVLHEAGRRLWSRRKDFVIVATGDPIGPVDEFTRLVGWQSQEDLPRHLHAADVVIFPTIAQEALGRTAVEAMAASLPVVASRIGGLPFTVADGATGLLCEPGDPDDLARKLEMLIDDPELRARMGTAGRRRFEEHYSWDVIIDRHYRPLLRHRDRNPGPPQGSASRVLGSPSTAGVRSAIRPASGNGFAPEFPPPIDRVEFFQQVARFFSLSSKEVEHRWQRYVTFHEAKGYERTLGELKTLCLDEAFVLCVAMGILSPRTIVEVGTQHGKSTRRILDMASLLGLGSRMVCFDLVNEVRHFTPGTEAELKLGDLKNRFRRDLLDAHQPGLIFLDFHAYDLLREAIAETLAHPRGCVLAIHDCSRGLCNPKMTITKDDPNITSSTGVWERYILAEVGGFSDPHDPRVDDFETASHRFRVFDTRHGLALIVPKAVIPARRPERPQTGDPDSAPTKEPDDRAGSDGRPAPTGYEREDETTPNGGVERP
jgi:glycosyltransferase involved in cell wall biosynthesis